MDVTGHLTRSLFISVKWVTEIVPKLSHLMVGVAEPSLWPLMKDIIKTYLLMVIYITNNVNISHLSLFLLS